MRFITPASGAESTRNHRKTIVGRKLAAPCIEAGSPAAMRPETGATMSQNPMTKKPASTGGSRRLFISLSAIVMLYNWSKLRYFSGIPHIVLQKICPAGPHTSAHDAKRAACAALGASGRHGGTSSHTDSLSLPAPGSPEKKLFYLTS